MRKITLILVFLFFQVTLVAQLDYKNKSTLPGANYFTIVKNTRLHFDNIKKNKNQFTLSERKQEKQFERWAYYWKDRVDQSGAFPSETLGFYNAGILDADGKIVSQPNLSRNSRLTQESWTNIGPQQNPDTNGYPNFPQLGRLNAFLRIKHPTDRNLDVLFVGAPVGGVWKSTDNGATWSPKLDMVAGIGVTDIKTASTTTYDNYTTKPIYISTGDYDGGHVRSIGVLKSTDGGETFSSTGLSHTLSEQKSLSQLLVVDDNTVLVGDNQYIKKTTDGGANWSNIYDSGFTNSNFARVAAIGSNIMFTGLFDIYFSSDSGVNWTVVNTSNDQDKNAVTVGSDGNFYVQGQDGQIEKFTVGANTFANVGVIPGNYESQEGYNQALIFKDNMFVVGEFNGQTSIDNGATWYRSLNGYYQNDDGGPQENDGTYIHSDHHGLGLLDGQFEFWSVNDGGLNFITYDNISDQTPTIEYKSNGVVVTQSYNVAITPNSTSGDYIMANQDNDGFSREMHNGSMQWIAAVAGDGISAAINYNSPEIRYLGSQNGGIIKTRAGFTGNRAGSSSGDITGAAFVWPLEIHTTDPTILYAGGDDLYKITDPNGAADISTSISNAVKLNAGAGQIERIATHGNGVAVVGANASRLSIDAGANWTTITNPSGLTINSVDFDQSNMSIVYCTVSGYTSGSKVFKSTNGGTTWTNISTGLPNIVIKEVVLKQNQGTEILFVGTELGVYFKKESDNWAKLGQGLPNVDVRDIDVNYTADRLVAATFGRGLWDINIANETLGADTTKVDDISFNVFPNPVSDGRLNITVDQEYKDFNYVVYNILGGVVLKGKNSNGIIDVSTLGSGIYVLKPSKNSVALPGVKFLVTK